MLLPRSLTLSRARSQNADRFLNLLPLHPRSLFCLPARSFAAALTLDLLPLYPRFHPPLPVALPARSLAQPVCLQLTQPLLLVIFSCRARALTSVQYGTVLSTVENARLSRPPCGSPALAPRRRYALESGGNLDVADHFLAESLFPARSFRLLPLPCSPSAPVALSLPAGTLSGGGSPTRCGHQFPATSPPLNCSKHTKHRSF